MRARSPISAGEMISRHCSNQWNTGFSCSELSWAAVVSNSALERVAFLHISRGPLKLGEKGVAGTDHGHFNLPAGITFLPDGSFYIADGYRNTRVIKFDANGKFQLEWGSKGTEPGEFNLVHSVAVDATRRVFVADRSNNRIQIFDAQGKFLEQWQHIPQPAYLLIAADNKSLWVASNGADRIAKYDMQGVLQTYWGVHGTLPGWITNFHNFAVDPSGVLYVADAFNNRVQKFVPRAGADRSRLVDQPLVLQ